MAVDTTEVNLQFHKSYGRSVARVLYLILMNILNDGHFFRLSLRRVAAMGPSKSFLV